MKLCQTVQLIMRRLEAKFQMCWSPLGHISGAEQKKTKNQSHYLQLPNGSQKGMGKELPPDIIIIV